VKNDDNRISFNLNIVIVKHGIGSKVIALAKSCGISGGTIVLGKGTAKSSLLRFLELAECSKEIVMVLSNSDSGSVFLTKVNRELKLEKPNYGIAFSIPVVDIVGTKFYSKPVNEECESEGDEMVLYNSIFVIVDKGTANHVVEAANQAGARGATILNARGSGSHETSKLFAIEIEPEKEIVIILLESENTSAVCEKIKNKINIDQPGKGIMFVQNVNQVYGVYK
jgi:nitrogen regulatory protein PII